jgi:hypothetical protein
MEGEGMIRKRGEDLGRGLILHYKFLQEVKEEDENWENISFWKLSQGTAIDIMVDARCINLHL